MAGVSEDAMDNYMYSPYSNPYSYRYCYPKGKGGSSWRTPRPPAYGLYGDGSSYFSGESATDYFDNFQRAQLKAILSQVNPNLTPRLRKANTRDVGIQVNPRQDAAVQCSLGPRTLLRRRRGPPLLRRWPEQPQQLLGEPVGSPPQVRFPRTIAVYSPIVSRRLGAFEEEDEEEEGEGGQQDEKETEEKTDANVEEIPAQEGEVREEEENKSVQGVTLDDEEKQEQKEACDIGKENLPEEEKPNDELVTLPQKDEDSTAEKIQPASQNGEKPPQPVQSKTRLRFQFLEQKYGYFHCKDCNIRWESAYVWCVQGTNKVYFKQYCRACQKTYNPYRVEDITCQEMVI
ncbi:zygote arrest protein 1 isoform X2 [Protopterus annectens]|uniref:zygote arrest protein 1 isoform X2 n=1 Tax=Protopterus annectens TaxID=7888 RepID=UPI001CF9700F|nr:zygote arrest protein 1 isoform X2 [Protopterus annectens]